MHIHGRLVPLIKALMTTAANPVPLKSVLNALGFPAGPFRLPLTPLPAPERERVLDAVREAGELVTFSPAGVG
jgi:4-hydroxy-tetrahydrodipicolinate synthase